MVENWWVQGHSESNPELLDAAALCRQLVPDGSVEAFLADHRHDLFPDAIFEDLFPSGRGRPSIPADVVATVMVLQALEGLSDRDAARALRDRISWKVACGLALDDEGFDFSVLTYWRTRLRKSEHPERIFDAVRSVIDERRRRGIAAITGAGRQQLGPVGSGNGACHEPTGATRPAIPVIHEQPESDAGTIVPDFVPDKHLDEHFTVAFPPDEVFEMFGDLARVAACLPGATLTAIPGPDRAEGLISVKLGPISASFRGAVRIERYPETLSGRIIGIGNDQRSRSSTQGDIRYRLLPVEGESSTRIELSIGYSLRGFLAQIAREGLVRDLTKRLTAEFARNLGLSLSGAAPEQPKQLNGLKLALDLFMKGLWKAFRRDQGA